MEDELLLQPAYLNALTRLTRLSLLGPTDPTGDVHEDDGPHYVFELPELELLFLTCLWAGDVEMQCPQLRILRFEDCDMCKLHLQASLEQLHLDNAALSLMHKGFPITNLLGLTYLSSDGACGDDSEAVLFQGLPLMTRLQALELHINVCSLPASLPSSLRDLTLTFCDSRAWDSSVIPLVQQLPGAEAIRIYVETKRNAFMGSQSLDHNLRPFLAMKLLKLLVLGSPQVWMPSALCQLGELEAEAIRLGKRLKLRY